MQEVPQLLRGRERPPRLLPCAGSWTLQRPSRLPMMNLALWFYWPGGLGTLGPGLGTIMRSERLWLPAWSRGRAANGIGADQNICW